MWLHYQRLEAGKITIKLAFCRTHLRRRFYMFHKSIGSPIANEAMERIGKLYAIERKMRGFPAKHRQLVRDRESRRIIDDLKPWLEKQYGRLSAKNKLAEAIAYAFNRWDGFTLFLEDGSYRAGYQRPRTRHQADHFDMQERTLAGSDCGAEHWAMASSIIETCRISYVEPFVCLKDVLERMVSGQDKANQIDQIMP